jgi:hypothetical protein
MNHGQESDRYWFADLIRSDIAALEGARQLHPLLAVLRRAFENVSECCQM